MELHMLSTVDNPYNPFTQFDEWDAWDKREGYYTTALLGRVVVTSPDLSEGDEDAVLERAIEEIVRENLSGMHISVTQATVPRAAVALATTTT